MLRPSSWRILHRGGLEEDLFHEEVHSLVVEVEVEDSEGQDREADFGDAVRAQVGEVDILEARP